MKFSSFFTSKLFNYNLIIPQWVGFFFELNPFFDKQSVQGQYKSATSCPIN